MIWPFIAAGICGQDIVTKDIVRQKIEENEEKPVCGGKIVVTKVFNDGAMLGFMGKHPQMLKNMTLLMLGALTGAMAVTSQMDKKTLKKLGLAMMTGGAASNAYERFVYGKVTDYIRFEAGPEKFRKLVFNTGDFAVILGSICVALGR